MQQGNVKEDLELARRYIREKIPQRQVNKIQHSFPSPRYWKQSEIPVEEVARDRKALRSAGRGDYVNLYLGVPYCIKTEPSKCGYCLFPVEDFVGNTQLEVYFDYLKREVAMQKEAMEGQQLGAVYFGGGTSNLYRAEKYVELMGLVRELFPVIADEVDLTLEGIPQLFTRDKIQAIKDAGMNRISMGVQQFNDDLNKFSGRRQTPKQVIQAVEWAREFGLGCNVDVIFGWPQQTVATMVRDLEKLIALGVYDITHYELNVGGPTDFALNRFHELPSTLANLEMYKVSRDLLRSHGYEQVTAYNWRKPGDPCARRYEEGVTHRFDSMNTVGIGYAAITFFGDASLSNPMSWSYINWRKIDNYKAAIDEGRLPIECGYRHEPEDFRLAMLFRNLFSLSLSRRSYRDAFGVDVYDEFEGVWKALEEYGFVKVTPESIQTVEDGVFFTPMIQALIAERRYRALRDERLLQGGARRRLPIEASAE
ncbi:MAG TPA: coproporphyrinogen-III oxidase family protein [Polyangiaceae bacterium]|nr:coproporphyrinogen-III oxidase family protein [Polyangiaceae bacterium]